MTRTRARSCPLALRLTPQERRLIAQLQEALSAKHQPLRPYSQTDVVVLALSALAQKLKVK